MDVPFWHFFHIQLLLRPLEIANSFNVIIGHYRMRKQTTHGVVFESLRWYVLISNKNILQLRLIWLDLLTLYKTN